MFPSLAEGTMQIAILEFAVEDEVIRVECLLGLLKIEAFELLQGRTVLVLNVE